MRSRPWSRSTTDCEASTWPPVAYDSIRLATLTPLPITPNFARRADPMLPTMTTAVLSPIPISRRGNPVTRFRRFTPCMAVCISIAQVTAAAA